MLQGFHKFNKNFLGEDGNVEGFWYNMKDQVVYTAHRKLIDPARTLAITVHGDGAATTKADGLFTISWSSLHSSGTTQETKNISQS